MPSPNSPPLHPSALSSSRICPPPRFDDIPHELKLVERWALWRIERNRTGAWRKMSFQPNGRRATRNDPKTWSSFAAARSAFQQALRSATPYDGIAFALGDGFAVIQLSGVLAPCATGNARAPSIKEQEQEPHQPSEHAESPNSKHETPNTKHPSGTPLAWSSRLVADFATYTEVGVDGHSLTLILHGPICRKPAESVLGPLAHPEGGLIEATDEPRFVGVTGRRWPENSRYQIQDRKAQYQALTRHLHSGTWPFPLSESGVPLPALSLVEGSPVEGPALSPIGVIAGAPPIEAQEPELHNTQGLAQRSTDSVPPSLCPSAPPPLSAPSLHLSVALSAAAVTTTEDAEDPRIADQIIELAMTEFRLGRTPADESFAVPIHGPNIAHMLRGGSAPLRKVLARRFYQRYGRALGSASLADALNLIDAQAGQLEPEQVALRVANLKVEPNPEHETQNTKHEFPTLNSESGTLNSEGIVIDLGRTDGRTIVVTPAGWTVADRSPVLFRRTPLSGQLPIPVPGGSLESLRSLVNVTDEGFQMLRGWLVAGLFPSIAHPILALRGEQGTGKSTALRMLAGLVDPSAALALSAPSDSENWITMADGGWCLPLDNVAGIAPWFSEALCRAVTGEGVVRRRLYTDGDFAVIAFRRVLALTCINLGKIAADLADRLLPVDLELIDKGARLPETQLLARYEALKPKIFGALLDDVAAVLGNLPHVHLEQLPRMADFARLLAALPSAPVVPLTLNSPLSTYLRLIDRLAVEVVEGEPVAAAVSEFMSTRDSWQGKATELLSLLPRPEEPRGWPKTGQYLAVRLNQIASALRTIGIAVDYTRAADYKRSRQIVLKSIPDAKHPQT